MFEPKRRARLKWACRRGMLELDVLFLPFVDEAFDSLSYEQQEIFENLLKSTAFFRPHYFFTLHLNLY